MYCVVALGREDFLITHPKQPGLVWSEVGWTPLSAWPIERKWPPLHFPSEDAADEYATCNSLYPRID